MQEPVISSYLAGAQVVGDDAASQDVVDQQLDAGSADGPAAQVPAAATVVNGGSIQETVTSDKPLAAVRVAIEELDDPSDEDSGAGPTEASAGAQAAPTPTGMPAQGYQEITLGQPSTTASIILTIQQQLPGGRFVLYFAAVDAAGTQGPPGTQSVQAIEVNTGDVQVSVSWNVDSDLDLHVVDPAGEEIFYDHDTAASGGTLDLDSNPECKLDHVRNENAAWQHAPAGTYTVRVDLFSACDVQPTAYVVTVQVAGAPIQVFPGTIDGTGDFGDQGDGQVVTTFDVTGPTATN